METRLQDVFIIGSKGIPANYGGYETFVEQLTSHRKNENIVYHVSCLAHCSDEFVHNNAQCFNVSVPNIGSAKAIYYDLAALKYCISYIKKNQIENAVVYVLACRIGPFIGRYKKELQKLNAKLYVNPDGHEWLRAKWNRLIRLYWKVSEKYMVKHADLLVCDSINIEIYIQTNYQKYNPKTEYIAYGANIPEKKEISKKYISWCNEHGVKSQNYYLVVGRFVPENNYETMILEFMKSNTMKDFVLISNVANNSFFEDLKKSTHFEQDSRIKFVGTVYDQELLMEIRQNAYGYLHGHEVGGTNPSLLEALASTQLNLLLDVGFNQEVGEDSALYWNKSDGNLANLIQYADQLDSQSLIHYAEKSTARIRKLYTWDKIVADYERLFYEK